MSWSRRRVRRTELLTALGLSLLVNAGVIVPGAYLERHPPQRPPETLDLELSPPPPGAMSELALPELLQRPPREKPARPAAPPDRPVAEKTHPRSVADEKKEKKEEPTTPEPARPLTVPEPRLKMVEVNNPESERPPDNARFLSDKNRRVEEETRAVYTNLEKHHDKPEPSSDPRTPKGGEPGSRQPSIAETREQPGERVQRGQRRMRAPRSRVSPLLSMRGQAARPEQQALPALAEKADGGTLAPGQAGRPGLPGRPTQRGGRRLELGLDYKSQERIDGQEGVKAREMARLSPSVPGRGGFVQKWQRVRSALENFIPEVKPGNQTALGTRADPFALYIARMHRKIHKFWGFGFLVDLDAKPDSNPMNDMNLWTMIEIVVAPDGSVDKATVVRPSGLLTYDVAALDTVFSAAPYEATPRAIRSADGKVYLHWRFHRDQRQCGTFGVDPFILTTPPRGPVDKPAGDAAHEGGRAQRELKRLHRGPDRGKEQYQAAAALPLSSSDDQHGGEPHRHGERERDQHEGHDHRKGRPSPAAGPAATRLDPTDAGALRAVRRFLAAFAGGDPGRLAAACGLPFRVAGRVVTTSRAELERMFRDLISEAGSRTAIAPARLLTVAQARGALGRLPPGVEPGQPVLLGLVTLGRTPATLIVGKEKSGWQVMGLNH